MKAVAMHVSVSRAIDRWSCSRLRVCAVGRMYCSRHGIGHERAPVCASGDDEGMGTLRPVSTSRLGSTHRIADDIDALTNIVGSPLLMSVICVVLPAWSCTSAMHELRPFFVTASTLSSHVTGCVPGALIWSRWSVAYDGSPGIVTFGV